LQIEVINTLLLLTAKPVIYLVNLSEKDYERKKNKHLRSIKQWVDEHTPGDLIIPFSVSFEKRLSEIPESEHSTPEYQAELAKSALPKIAVSGYQALGLQNYFTCGPDEVRAWTIRKGTKAPAAAGVIHTDFEKNFVCGEIMKFEDLKELGTEAAVKAAGKYNTKGKEYEIQVYLCLC
jgi:obg-like ATPase 1